MLRNRKMSYGQTRPQAETRVANVSKPSRPRSAPRNTTRASEVSKPPPRSTQTKTTGARKARRGQAEGDEKRQPVAQPGSPLPRSRSATPPVNRLDLQDRRDTRALRDWDSLKRYNRLYWHRTARCLVLIAGVTVLVVGFLLLVKWWKLPIGEASGITVAGLVSGTVGLVMRELLRAIIGKRQSGDHRREDDSS
jgi:hypothetical protein